MPCPSLGAPLMLRSHIHKYVVVGEGFVGHGMSQRAWHEPDCSRGMIVGQQAVWDATCAFPCTLNLTTPQVNVYTPNSGEGLKRLDYRVGDSGWDSSLAAKIAALQAKKPVVVAGDLNCGCEVLTLGSHTWGGV